MFAPTVVLPYDGRKVQPRSCAGMPTRERRRANMGRKKSKDLSGSLSSEEQEAIEQRAEEMTLAELRKALDYTQVTLANVLGVGQGAISNLESRTDMLLSTLASYVEAMGGSLHLIAEFPKLPSIKISGIGDIIEDASRSVDKELDTMEDKPNKQGRVKHKSKSKPSGKARMDRVRGKGK